MSDRFEDDMRQRLQYYEEEPRSDFWDNLAPQINAVNRGTSYRWSWLLLVPAILVPVRIGHVYSEPRWNSVEQLVTVNNNDFKTEGSKNKIQKVHVLVAGTRQSTSLHATTSIHKDIRNPELKKGEGNNNDEVEQRDVTEAPVAGPVLESDTNQQVSSVTANETDKEPEVRSSKTENAIMESAGKEPDGTIVRKQGIRPRRHSIYLIAMPTFGYQRIESNQNDNIIIESIKRIPAFSVKRLGLRAEVGVEYVLSRKVKLFTGLLYYQRKQTIDFTEMTVDSLRITGENGEVTIDPVFKYEDKSLEYELKNLGIQFGFNYELSRTKFLHVLGTGIELHKPVNKSRFNEINQDFGQHPDYYVFYNLYYRLQYPSTGRLRAVFQPSFNYSLYINQNMNAPFYVKPYGLGLQVGGTYNF